MNQITSFKCNQITNKIIEIPKIMPKPEIKTPLRAEGSVYVG